MERRAEPRGLVMWLHGREERTRMGLWVLCLAARLMENHTLMGNAVERMGLGVRI